jgi:hypothetical protein
MLLASPSTRSFQCKTTVSDYTCTDQILTSKNEHIRSSSLDTHQGYRNIEQRENWIHTIKRSRLWKNSIKRFNGGKIALKVPLLSIFTTLVSSPLGDVQQRVSGLYMLLPSSYDTWTPLVIPNLQLPPSGAQAPCPMASGAVCPTFQAPRAWPCPPATPRAAPCA